MKNKDTEDLEITESELLSELEKYRPKSTKWSDLTTEQLKIIKLSFDYDRQLTLIAFQSFWLKKYGYKVSTDTISNWKQKSKGL